MSGERLLRDICSICNTNKFKYRCPGCAAQTCSLPCYKRHKQWAQCTGKRDPTKYVKKAQLATPAGIDHDFNFLSSIERGLERAEKDVNEKLLSAPNSDVQTISRRGKVTDGRLAAAGVTVIRAPKGLSRATENNTHRNSKGNIHWTVEWIHPNRSRSLSGLSEKAPLAEAYQNDFGQPLPKSTRKRKRAQEESTSIQQGSYIKPKVQEQEEVEDAPTLPLAKNGHDGTIAEGEETKSPPRRRTSPTLEPTSDRPTSVAGESKPDLEMASAIRPEPSVHEPESEFLSSEYCFFLLRPRTSSTRHVLIPVSPNTTLNECLRGRTVLEFPTIYVFSGSLPQLSEDFILEEEYVKKEAEDEKELAEFMKDVKSEAVPATKKEGGHDKASEELDSKRILDVLKQDLGAAI